MQGLCAHIRRVLQPPPINIKLCQLSTECQFKNISLDIYYTSKTRIKQISPFSTLPKLEKIMSTKSNLKKDLLIS